MKQEVLWDILGVMKGIPRVIRLASSSVEVKGDDAVGHHAIVTGADHAVQEFLLRELHQQFPRARFITEEKVESAEHSALILPKNPTAREIDEEPLVFVMDPIDGTSSFQRGLVGQWSSSVGILEYGRLSGGAITVPDYGMAIYGNGETTRVTQAGSTERETRIFDKPERKQTLLLLGPDIHFLDPYGDFVLQASKEVRTTLTIGSCCAGLALVAAGMVEALVQPVQCPWDYAAGTRLVEGAGGKVIFYHYRDGVPVRMEKLDPPSFSAVERNTAFIAGTPNLAEWLFELLQRTWAGTNIHKS